MKHLKNRYISSNILSDLKTKMVLLGGPRQVGKTTLSKSLINQPYYLNYDVVTDRKIIVDRSWPSKNKLLILDEIHKMKKWKSYLKGIYDEDKEKPFILVTGSAKLDTIKKVGDSLAGRFLYWKLHPLCLKELNKTDLPDKIMEKLLNQSGFPEPYLSNENFYPRWAKTHQDIILRQDLLDMQSVSDILSMELLLELLSQRVGSPVSYENLAKDLDKSPNTIKSWIGLLENMFVIFRVSPFTKEISRSLKKMSKFYFLDTARVQGDIGAKFENLVACSLLKEIDYVNDLHGANLKLNYFRNRSGQELDFAISDKNKPYLAIEAKWSDDTLSKGFNSFQSVILKHKIETIQLVAKINKEKQTPSGTKILKASTWLSNLDFSNYTKREKIRV